MPPVLRKRKAPAPPPAPAPKKQPKTAKAATKVKEAVKEKPAKSEKPNGSSKPAKPVVGDTITLEGFGGEVETNDGTKTTLKSLLDESKSGVVLFVYPKASTPGCTNQVCLFRDNYESLTAGGLAIYGLSTDSPKANTTFKQKQNLPYALLCDSQATLIEAIGLKKAPKGSTRGVFAVDKAGKVLVAEPGGPAATLEAVKKLLDSDDAADKEDDKEAAAATTESTEEAKPTNGEAATEKKDEAQDEEKTEDEPEKKSE